MSRGEKGDKQIEYLFQKYQKSFREKITETQNKPESDLLMDVFGITYTLKKQNMQYWNRELGMIWQTLTKDIARAHAKGFGEPMKINKDEPFDYSIEQDAIDTKYRLGSGDSGTIKKLKQYAKDLKKLGYRPVMLLFREDNLATAINACKKAGWTVYMGKESLAYIQNQTGIHIEEKLKEMKNQYPIKKSEG